MGYQQMIETAAVSMYAQHAKLSAYQSVSAHGAVGGADPHSLVLMLMDAGLERMASARGCIERKEMARKARLLHSCVQIVGELRGSLDTAKGGELAHNLSDLYDYMIRRLLKANAESDAGCINEVVALLSELRGAWAAIGPEVRKSA